MSMRTLALAAAVAACCFADAHCAHRRCTELRFQDAVENPVAWGFNTPEEDGRPGQYYLPQGSRRGTASQLPLRDRHVPDVRVVGVQARAIQSRRDVHEGRRRAGRQVARDGLGRARCRAWRSDYVDAREVIYADLTQEEFAQRQRNLARSEEKLCRRRRARSRENALGAGQGRHDRLARRLGRQSQGRRRRLCRTHARQLNAQTGKSALDGNTFSAFGILKGGSIDGSIAYSQLRDSDNPYDPKFVRPPKAPRRSSRWCRCPIRRRTRLRRTITGTTSDTIAAREADRAPPPVHRSDAMR